ncbi:MAG: N-acyl homoserine lactonase family protein [Salinibacterium sp.]|nr:N-acyl homoserine lactonase family protein [Salinibacterium sp.]
MTVLSTGSVRIRPQHVETDGSPFAWWLLTSRRWTAPRPINVYVIEHPEGLVLFDTGQDRASLTDPEYFPRGLVRFLYGRLASFDLGPTDTLTAQLASIGHDIADVRTVILSHLHQDHIGGLPELGHAEIVVSATEWAQVSAPLPELNGVLADHVTLPGLRWTPVTTDPVVDPTIAPFTSAHDVRGDGSLVLLPTPGHTPGSLSLFVRMPGLRPLLLVGDLTYDVDLLWAGRIPGVGSRRGLRDSTRMVAQLRAHYPDLVVLAAHDPAAGALLDGARS